MNLPKKIATVTCFSVLFLVLFVPLGALIRTFRDPLKLRRNRGGASYFNFS